MSRGIYVLPDEHIFLRLSNGSLKLIECKPNQIIEVNKLGIFSTNQLLGRPYYHTYELLDKAANEQYPKLRVVSPAELDVERLAGETSTREGKDTSDSPAEVEAFDLVNGDGDVIMKNNRLIVDDATRQKLTHDEIEELKKSTGGREIIEKILANHEALDEKTAFSKAKYTLRKTRKYLKRFVLLPMELRFLTEHILDKEASRIMDIRDETLALVTSWSNAHWNDANDTYEAPNGEVKGDGRILVVDDTGGLLVAALAERKGILRLQEKSVSEENEDAAETPQASNHRDFLIPSMTNSITLLHPAIQPNVSVLKYFGYDTNQPDHTHPLHTHLKPLSWLQLLHPEEDPLYQEPYTVPAETVQSWKAGKRGAYHKKRRRWQRCRAIIDDARSGDFDALVIASHMDPVSILPHTIPLLRGGAHVVIYSPSIEPLVKLMDLYSKERRAAYLGLLNQDIIPTLDDFPVDPRLLLAPTLQTSRVREYQVLPGRTHPLMTSKGGSEGYVMTARRVIPLEGTVEARGNFGKKRKLDATTQF